MSAITLEGISKRYRIYDRPIDRLKEIVSGNRRCYHREFWSLRDIDAIFEEGLSTAIIGPNGSGKSTLLQIIAGVIQPTLGRMQVKGRVTAILELGAGFQPDYTGRENVMMNGMILGIPIDEMRARLPEIAEFADIGDFFDQPIKTYSSGMIVRLAFATAITVDPDILLVDEALAVGDINFQQKCFDKIKQLQQNRKTIILVTHNMHNVRDVCQKALLLNGGKMVAYGTGHEVVPQYEEIMERSGAIVPKVFAPGQQPQLVGW